jgi:hypothetical protein
MKCRATNVVTSEGNIGSFRRWSAFGTTREGYYGQMFAWEAQNDFSYLLADQTTPEFVKWIYEFGDQTSQVSHVQRYKDADYVTFRDNKTARDCIGFRRLGPPQRGGYQSVTGGIMCAPRGKPFGSNDVAIFIDSVRLQSPRS